MRQTKKITISAMMVAMGVLFMFLGALIETLDLTVAALCSLLIVFVHVEVGRPYQWLVWLATSLIGALLFFKGFIFAYFLIFGVYPIIKAYIEKLPRPLWIPIRLVYFNIMLVALSFISELVFGIPLFAVENKLFFAGIWILCNLAFLLYDYFLLIMVEFYFRKLRHRFAKLLK